MDGYVHKDQGEATFGSVLGSESEAKRQRLNRLEEERDGGGAHRVACEEKRERWHRRCCSWRSGGCG
ncbi:hypothetical protein GUJ93_ZPchr0001g29629 [Zizania palustris]|uniref:Uncharacterized protein n=1 Tax=Zizania palustris TaxID=103762 RepID=A0A8J5RPR3_ZIZPA|nr:hypothetical protein GUJ93_ZPchr0001g29629 [Zizania palustris]